MEKEPVKVTVDGESFEVETGKRIPVAIDSISFGTADHGVVGTKYFYGSVKQFKFTIKPPERYKIIDDLFQLTK